MKLSKTQREVLEKMRDGALLCVAAYPPWRCWLSDGRFGPTVHGNTRVSLAEKGLIRCHDPMECPSRHYHITDAGRKALEEA